MSFEMVFRPCRKCRRSTGTHHLGKFTPSETICSDCAKQPWLVTEIEDLYPGQFLRYQVIGENFEHPQDSAWRKLNLLISAHAFHYETRFDLSKVTPPKCDCTPSTLEYEKELRKER